LPAVSVACPGGPDAMVMRMTSFDLDRRMSGIRLARFGERAG
jgi:hypothetical protein